MSAGRLFWYLVSAIAAGVLVTAILWTQVIQPAKAPPRAPAASVDVSDLPGFWESNYKTASWYSATSVPTWDGNVLTAKTSAADQSTATTICGALSMYWVSSGKGFHSVRVVDSAGQVLVSRHTESDQCTWRR